MRTSDEDTPKPAVPRPAPGAAATSPAPEAAPLDEKEAKARTDKEIAERLSNPPETPTPTQAEADAIKSGEAVPPARQERDVKPGTTAAGYTTR